MLNISLHTNKDHLRIIQPQEFTSFYGFDARENSLYEFDENNLSSLILYDLDNNAIIKEFESIESVDIHNYDISFLSIVGIQISPMTNFNFPNSVNTFEFVGGDLTEFYMQSRSSTSQIWSKLLSVSNSMQFFLNGMLEKRISSYQRYRQLLIELNSIIKEEAQFEMIQRISCSNITSLSLGYIYLTDQDFLHLSQNENLIELDLRFNYNDYIPAFPKNLESLTIYGTTIQSLSEINLDSQKLRYLSLEGNDIIDITGLRLFPEQLQTLIIRHNRIEKVNLNELPRDLVELDLDNNFIDNSLFEQDIVSIYSKLRSLKLSNNKFEINTWLLERILYIFPNLEYLVLEGNFSKNVLSDFIHGQETEYNCLEAIKIYLSTEDETLDFTEMNTYSDKNILDYRNMITVEWAYKNLPTKVILFDLQKLFLEYFGQLSSFNLFECGIYCYLKTHKSLLQITADHEKSSIKIQLYSQDQNGLEKIFYKYFTEIYITLNNHINICFVPKIEFDTTFDEPFESFFLQAYDLDQKIANRSIFNLHGGHLNLIISSKLLYSPIDKLALIIFREKMAYFYVINNNSELTNVNSFGEIFRVSLRTAESKQVFFSTVSSTYLSNLFGVTNISNKDKESDKLICVYNLNYFKSLNEELYINNLTSNNWNFEKIKGANIGGSANKKYLLLDFQAHDSKVHVKYRKSLL